MSSSSVQNSLVPAICITGAAFTVTTIPLALFRSEVVEVQLQNQPIFASEVRDLAGPYLGFSGLVSAAMGATVLGFSGWRQSARQSDSIRHQLSDLQRNLQVKQAELEEIKFSSARLRNQNLDIFLESSSPLERAANPEIPMAPVAPIAAAGSQVAAPAGSPGGTSNGKTPAFSVNPPLVNPPEVRSDASFVMPAVGSSYPSPALDNLEKSQAPGFLQPPHSQPANGRFIHRESSVALGQVAPIPSPDLLEQLLHQLNTLACQVEELRTRSDNEFAA